MIPFDAIRDDGITLAEPLFWTDASELVNTFIGHAKAFRLDRQEGQSRHLMFAVEAAGMVPQVQRIADPFGIAVHSSGRFDSLTAKYDLAKSLGQYDAVEVLHIGDHDPSGVHLYLSMADDVQTIAEDLRLDTNVLFSRLAVTPAQVREQGLPTAPPRRPTGAPLAARRCSVKRSRLTSSPTSSAMPSMSDWTAKPMQRFSLAKNAQGRS
jgi:hypothetical protein